MASQPSEPEPGVYAPNGKRLWFAIPSFTNPDSQGYIVKRDANGKWHCDCPVSVWRPATTCKHLKALKDEGLLW